MRNKTKQKGRLMGNDTQKAIDETNAIVARLDVLVTEDVNRILNDGGQNEQKSGKRNDRRKV